MAEQECVLSDRHLARGSADSSAPAACPAEGGEQNAEQAAEWGVLVLGRERAGGEAAPARGEQGDAAHAEPCAFDGVRDMVGAGADGEEPPALHRRCVRCPTGLGV